jgi:hypothetical protein
MKEITIPSLRSLSPHLVALEEKRAELLAEITPRRAECAVIRARLRTAPSAGNESENRLAALLGGSPAPVIQPDEARLRTLQVEISDRQNGISLIDSEILKESRLARIKQSDAVYDGIKRLGQAFAAAFRDLHRAHVDFESFVSRLEDADGNVSTLRLTPAGLNTPRDPNSPYGYGFRELIEAGFIERSQLPKELR